MALKVGKQLKVWVDGWKFRKLVESFGRRLNVLVQVVEFFERWLTVLEGGWSFWKVVEGFVVEWFWGCNLGPWGDAATIPGTFAQQQSFQKLETILGQFPLPCKTRGFQISFTWNMWSDKTDIFCEVVLFKSSNGAKLHPPRTSWAKQKYFATFLLIY